MSIFVLVFVFLFYLCSGYPFEIDLIHLPILQDKNE